MSIDISITKKFKDFTLQTSFRSDATVTGILGASGCGKSMTLRCIAGIERPDSGHIIINGKTLFDSQKRICLKPQQRRTGYLFQNYALFNKMSVERNIMAGARGSRTEKKEKAAELIHMFELDGLEKRFPHQLSGGQQQRTALARMLAADPEIILLDEAFSALDSQLRERLQYEFIKVLECSAIPAIIVSHDRDEIYKLTEDTVIMDNGRVCRCGNTKDVFLSPGDSVSARLTGCRNISPCRIEGKHLLFAEDWGIYLETEYDIDQSVKFVGIRAHDILAAPDNCTLNTLNVSEERILESPFEYTRILRTQNGGILWQKFDRGKSDRSLKVMLPPHSLLLLK